MTIRAKLLAGFGGVLGLLGLVVAVAVFGMRQMDTRAAEVAQQRLPALYYAEEASSALLTVRENMFSLALQKDMAKRDADTAKMKAAAAKYDEMLTALEQSDLNEEAQALVAE